MHKYNCTLLVDDDPISCFINQKIIELADITEHVAVVQNGAEAISYITDTMRVDGKYADCPDLIFLDLNMPVMNGFEFLKKFETLEPKYRDHVEIVVLTSSNNERDIIRAKSFDVKSYLSKPLTLENLESIFTVAK